MVKGEKYLRDISLGNKKIIGLNEKYAIPSGNMYFTMLTTFGVSHNEYWNMVQNEVTMDDLFWGAMNNAKK